jgi:hypothetical protein
MQAWVTIFVMRCCATFENGLVYVRSAIKKECHIGSLHFTAVEQSTFTLADSYNKNQSKQSLPRCTGDTRSVSCCAFCVWLFCSGHSRP